MQTKHHNTAGCFLIRKKDGRIQILLLYKKWSEDNQGWPASIDKRSFSGWVPPKGHIEDNETKEQTAIRETREETGYQNIKIVKYLKTLNIEYPWDDGFMHKKAIHYFLAELTDDKMKAKHLSKQEQSSTIKQEWFDLNEVKKQLKFDDEREILDKVIKYYRKKNV